MIISMECFKDEEIRSEIGAYRNQEIDSDELAGFFENLLSLFEEYDGGKDIATVIQKEWNIFKDERTARTVLQEFINKKNPGYDIDTPVDYTDEIKKRISVWERVKANVKEVSRFFTSMDEFAVYNYLEPTNGLDKGDKLYRSRVTPIGISVLPKEEMGCPPVEKATAGRVNPIGIPYLYLSDSAKTTYYEVRAVYLDKLSVGTFEVTRKLKLMDFAYKVNLFLTYNEGDKSLKEVIIKKKIIDSIAADMSKPLRRFDSELEYVPTQLLCEYCRRLADGIIFDSSLHKGGRNYVLFDEKDAACTNVESHEITRIDIDVR